MDTQMDSGLEPSVLEKIHVKTARRDASRENLREFYLCKVQVLGEKSVVIDHQPESTVPKRWDAKEPVLRYLS